MSVRKVLPNEEGLIGWFEWGVKSFERSLPASFTHQNIQKVNL